MNQETLLHIGRNIKRRRRELQLSQVHLAYRVGFSAGWMKQTELGKNKHLKIEQLKLIGDALDVDTTYLTQAAPPINNTRKRKDTLMEKVFKKMARERLLKSMQKHGRKKTRELAALYKPQSKNLQDAWNQVLKETLR